VHGNRLHPQQVAFYAVSLYLHTAQYFQALHSALRAPFAQQCFRSATQQSAFAAGCSRAASLQLHLPLFSARCRIASPEGLRLRSIAFARLA